MVVVVFGVAGVVTIAVAINVGVIVVVNVW